MSNTHRPDEPEGTLFWRKSAPGNTYALSDCVNWEANTQGDCGGRVWRDEAGTVKCETCHNRPECMNAGPDCAGHVEHRMPLSGTGRSFPRCDHHWDLRLDQEEQLRERYPVHQPSDFDPYYAGESWDGDD